MWRGRGAVKREVVRVVSPGTLTDTNYLDAREPAFLMSIVGADLKVGPYNTDHPVAGTDHPAAQTEQSVTRTEQPVARTLSGPRSHPRFGVALLDLSTGEFTTAEYQGQGGLQA